MNKDIPFEARAVAKRYGKHDALRDISLSLGEGRVIGLLGRNGAGKSTLLNLASGLALPTAGECLTFGVPTARLGEPELARMGLVQQDARLLEWMSVRQHLDFHAHMHLRWDRALEARLLKELELDASRVTVQLSPGDRQKLAIMLAMCHRPALLLLDEPMSALDPIVRGRLIGVLLELLRDDGCTVVISSHLLSDIEKLIDWVVCLHEGLLVEDCAFDALQESFSEWTLTSPAGALPPRFDAPFILSQQGHERMRRLTVRTDKPEAAQAFAEQHRAQLSTRALTLDEIFPHITSNRTR